MRGKREVQNIFFVEIIEFYQIQLKTFFKGQDPESLIYMECEKESYRSTVSASHNLEDITILLKDNSRV